MICILWNLNVLLGSFRANLLSLILLIEPKETLACVLLYSFAKYMPSCCLNQSISLIVAVIWTWAFLTWKLFAMNAIFLQNLSAMLGYYCKCSNKLLRGCLDLETTELCLKETRHIRKEDFLANFKWKGSIWWLFIQQAILRVKFMNSRQLYSKLYI